jgi:hypothetical protein
VDSSRSYATISCRIRLFDYLQSLSERDNAPALRFLCQSLPRVRSLCKATRVCEGGTVRGGRGRGKKAKGKSKKAKAGRKARAGHLELIIDDFLLTIRAFFWRGSRISRLMIGCQFPIDGSQLEVYANRWALRVRPGAVRRCCFSGVLR